MAITPLEQTLIDQAHAHQEALAAYYPKHQDGPFNEDEHADYLKHSGALNGLLELAHCKSGLSDQAAEQLRQVEEEDAATFRLYFPVETECAENIVAQPDIQHSEQVTPKASRVMVDEAHRVPQFTAEALQTVRDTRTKN
jgi:hypothetical protein